MNRVFLLVVALTAFTNVACSHVVRIESSPGADIYVDGAAMGKSPASYEDKGGDKPVKVTAKLNGREADVSIERTETNWTNIGVGAGIGTAACLASNALLTVASFVIPIFACGGCVTILFPFVGAGVGWFMGKSLPDSIKVNLDAPPSPAALRRQDDDDVVAVAF